MLGALKRRLKPKRAAAEKENQNGRKNVHNRSEAIIPVDVARLAPSQRQIHPLFEENAQLPAYDENTSPNKSTPTPNLKRLSGETLQSPLLQLPKKSPVEPMYHGSPHFLTPTIPASTFSPAPNICVEKGRIEFIKSPSEGTNLAAAINPTRSSFDKKMKLENLFQCSGVFETKNDGAARRAQQTQLDLDDSEKTEEKCDVAKEVLETRVKELEKLLELEQKAVQKERSAVTRLQRQLGKREATQRDVDREKRLRADTESRLRETVSESERYRTSLAGLQREFSKMEDTVRTMLQYKTRCELLNQEKVYLTAAYESRVHQYQNTITELEQENESMRQQLRLLETTGTTDLSTALLDRLRYLENENAHLSQDADFQRKEYEKCLDDIANQVVRALVSQKGLREEIGNLQRRIKDLENQNQALTNILVHKLDDSNSLSTLPSAEGKSNKENHSSETVLGSFSTNMCSLKTFADSSPGLNHKAEERRLLRRLHFSDLGDKNILKSLSSFESLIYVPLQRPRSLNLHLHTSPKALSAVNVVTSKRCQHKKSKLNLVTLNKKSGEDEGNESPESGNRDEGYSTMSSDVQGTGETNELSKRELEDLKEASDETDVIVDSNGEMTSIVVVEDMSDADLFFIPLDLSLAFNARHSYPPSKKLCPFQHTVRSFSDSHLCLKLTTTSTAPSAVSPSVFLLDLLERSRHIRKNKPSFNLSTKQEPDKEVDDFRSSSGSWCTAGWWDSEFVQHWLKLEDTRLKQQQQRDLLQLQYDRTEIEEWSMSLSCEDIGKSTSEDLIDSCKFDEMLDSPKLDEQSKAESDLNEWNDYNPGYSTFSKKADSTEGEDFGEKPTWRVTSPSGSWSSGKTNSEECCRLLSDCYLNDHSGVESNYCCAVSDDAEESSIIDTDFTRDFYRLVKFESTKSLASNSSKSNAYCDVNSLNQPQTESDQEREMALQDVLNYIAEQQKYCDYREEGDTDSQSCRNRKSLDVQQQNESDINQINFYCVSVGTKNAKELTDHSEQNVPVQESEIGKTMNQTSEINQKTSEISDNPVNKNPGSPTIDPLSKKTVSSVRRPGKRPAERETKLPVRNFNPKNLARNGKTRTEHATKTLELTKSKPVIDSKTQNKKQERKSLKCNLNKFENPEPAEMSESLSSSVSTPDTIVLRTKSPGAGSPTTEMPTSSKLSNSMTAISNIPRPRTNPRVRKSKIPVVSNKKPETSKSKILDLEKPNCPEECGLDRQNILKTRVLDSIKPTAKKTFDSSIPKIVVVNETSFHEKATSKDVIEELNRMIRKGEETIPKSSDRELRPLDMACCCSTGWVHVERDIDFTDPKARANLLDVMLASSGSSGGSCSSSDSGGDEHINYTHLHRLHRFRRQRKASATREQLGVLRYSLSSVRPTIIGRENFFVRYGEKEKEAVASFDFLEDISTTSASGCSSCDSLDSNQSTCLKSAISSIDQELPSPEIDLCTPVTPTTPITPSDDSEGRVGESVILSDSCADSCSESMGSFEEQS